MRTFLLSALCGIYLTVGLMLAGGCASPSPAPDSNAPFMHQTNAIPQPYWTNALPAVTP